MYHIYIQRVTKALLIFGSAMVFLCCGGETASVETKSEFSLERVMTESSDNLTIIMSENGRPSYKFEAPRVEGYNLAKEPYREFVKGVDITTFDKDSLYTVDGTLTANYAIYYEERKLWEAMGDVVVKKSDGKELYSQQLFWNAQTRRIYSNVDTKILDRETGDVYLGEGFESDEDMVEWSFRKMKGRMTMEVEMKDQEATDETQGDDPLGDSAKSDSLSNAKITPEKEVAHPPKREVVPTKPVRHRAAPSVHRPARSRQQNMEE